MDDNTKLENEKRDKTVFVILIFGLPLLAIVIMLGWADYAFIMMAVGIMILSFIANK